MRFVDYHQIPRLNSNVVSLVSRKVIGTDCHFVGKVKGLRNAALKCCVVRWSFDDRCGYEELFRKLLMPLFSKVRRGDDQDAPLTFSPKLRDDETRFDRLSQANFIGKER